MTRKTFITGLVAAVLALGAGTAVAAPAPVASTLVTTSTTPAPGSSAAEQRRAPEVSPSGQTGSLEQGEQDAGSNPAQGTTAQKSTTLVALDPITDPIVDPIIETITEDIMTTTAPDGTAIIQDQPGETVVTTGNSQVRTPKGRVADKPDAGAQVPEDTSTDPVEPSTAEPETTPEVAPVPDPDPAP